MSEKKRWVRSGRFKPGEYYRFLGGLINVFNWSGDTVKRMLEYADKYDYDIRLKGIRLFRKIFIGYETIKRPPQGVGKMSDKKRFMKVSDGCTSLTADIEYCLPEIELLCKEMAVGEKWTFEIVEMTQEELDALPVHSGW